MDGKVYRKSGDGMSIREDAGKIIHTAIDAALPDNAVKKALKKFKPSGGKLIVVALGKAAWQMANAASSVLEDKISKGIVITKYGHVLGEIPHMICCEAGHPIPDENSFASTKKALDMVAGLNENDDVILLISGGGSALFESPIVSGDELRDITRQLLSCGADIVEMNTIRKRLSNVKGGRFATACMPAKVYAIVLSDIIGDPLDMIASGVAYPDSSTCKEANEIIKKYGIKLSESAKGCMNVETPKELSNVTTVVNGSVKQLCMAAKSECERLGYEPRFLTASMCCEAREAGSMLASIARDHQDEKRSVAYICGGETVVHLNGKGLGGRNQEIALSAAAGIDGLKDTAIFSIGSDGTDGPTDAAGGYADSFTAAKLREKNISIDKALLDNASYNALKEAGGLIITGPTGTNVNDLTVVLIKR